MTAMGYHHFHNVVLKQTHHSILILTTYLKKHLISQAAHLQYLSYLSYHDIKFSPFFLLLLNTAAKLSPTVSPFQFLLHRVHAPGMEHY